MTVSKNDTPGALPALVLGIALVLLSACAKRPGRPVPEDLEVFMGKEAAGRTASAAAYHYMRGELHAQSGEFEQALAEFEQAANYDPSSVYLQLTLAGTRLALRRTAGARDALKRALELEPGNLEAHLMLGKLELATGALDAAIGHLGQAAKLDPENLEVHVVHGTALLEARRLDEALGVLSGVEQRFPMLDMAHYSLGQAHAAKGEWAKAEEQLRQAFSLNPSHLSAYAELVRIRLKQDPEATLEETHASLSAELLSDDPAISERIGGILAEHPEPKDFLRALREADPLNPNVFARLGLIYYEQERNEDAVVEFQTALASEPDNDAVRYYLGIAFVRLGNSSRGREVLEAIAADSDIRLDAVLYLAYLDEEEGRIDRAIERLRTAYKQHPGSVELARMIGDVLRRAGRVEEAIAVLSEAGARFPDDPELFYSLGVAHYDAGNLEGMADAMQRVIEIDPQHAHAMNFLGYSWAEKGIRLEEAERLIKRALEILPNDGYITDSLGWVYYRQGRVQEALRVLEEAARLAPNDPEISSHLAKVYEELGRLERALATYEQARALAEDGEHAELLAELDRAIESLRRRLDQSRLGRREPEPLPAHGAA